MRTQIDITPLTPALTAAMIRASDQDGGHCAPFATHAFVRAGEIVGAAAFFAPVITFWAHTQKLHPRESFDLIARSRATGMKQAGGACLTVCSPESPLRPFLERMGFAALENTDLFVTT